MKMGKSLLSANQSILIMVPSYNREFSIRKLWKRREELLLIVKQMPKRILYPKAIIFIRK
jgi:hypothetical protein